MQIDWLKLAPALLLLLVPIGLFHGRHVRFRTVPANFEGYWSRTFALGLHTVDLCRAILGAWLLVQALAPAAEVQDTTAFALSPPQVLVLATQVGVIFVATLLQTFVCKEIDAANPPIAFVIGIIFGFFPPLIAAFAVFVGVMAGLGLRSVAAFFPVLALALLGSGALFDSRKLIYGAVAVAAVMITPWLFTLLFPRHFVIAYAPKKTAGASSEPPPR